MIDQDQLSKVTSLLCCAVSPALGFSQEAPACVRRVPTVCEERWPAGPGRRGIHRTVPAFLQELAWISATKPVLLSGTDTRSPASDRAERSWFWGAGRGP